MLSQRFSILKIKERNNKRTDLITLILNLKIDISLVWKIEEQCAILLTTVPLVEETFIALKGTNEQKRNETRLPKLRFKCTNC